MINGNSEKWLHLANILSIAQRFSYSNITILIEDPYYLIAPLRNFRVLGPANLKRNIDQLLKHKKSDEPHLVFTVAYHRNRYNAAFNICIEICQ